MDTSSGTSQSTAVPCLDGALGQPITQAQQRRRCRFVRQDCLGCPPTIIDAAPPGLDHRNRGPVPAMSDDGIPVPGEAGSRDGVRGSCLRVLVRDGARQVAGETERDHREAAMSETQQMIGGLPGRGSVVDACPARRYRGQRSKVLRVRLIDDDHGHPARESRPQHRIVIGDRVDDEAVDDGAGDPRRSVGRRPGDEKQARPGPLGHRRQSCQYGDGDRIVERV